MYAFPFALVLAGLGVGLAYVLLGASCYFAGYRTERPRLKTFGRVLLTRSPACIVGAALAYVLLSTGIGVLGLVALLAAGVGALVPPARATMLAFDAEAV